MNDYLPISKKDMRKRGWDEVDFVYVIRLLEWQSLHVC